MCRAIIAFIVVIVVAGAAWHFISGLGCVKKLANAVILSLKRLVTGAEPLLPAAEMWRQSRVQDADNEAKGEKVRGGGKKGKKKFWHFAK